jgi:hypothetical protein
LKLALQGDVLALHPLQLRREALVLGLQLGQLRFRAQVRGGCALRGREDPLRIVGVADPLPAPRELGEDEQQDHHRQDEDAERPLERLAAAGPRVGVEGAVGVDRGLGRRKLAHRTSSTR